MNKLYAVCILLFCATVAYAQPAAFNDGLSERQSYETWFNSLSGDYQGGVLYWVNHRSLRPPGDCESGLTDAWKRGCIDAKQRLDPTDRRRTTEPDYRRGWNSYVSPAVPSSATPISVTPTPAAIPEVPIPRPPPGAVYADAQIVCPEPLHYGYVQGPFAAMQQYQRAQAQAQYRACQDHRRAAQDIIDSYSQEVDRIRQSNQRLREEAVERRQQAERAVETDRLRTEQALAAERARAQQVALENSPDNVCAERETARRLMQEFDRFDAFVQMNWHAIDIEHLTTSSPEGTGSTLVCHGTFILGNGLRMTGTMSFRTNIAGDPIVRWRKD